MIFTREKARPEIRLRLAFLSLVLAAACAGAAPRPGGDADGLQELRAQIAAQSALVAQQQRRIEELEIKLAALQSRALPAPARAAQPASPARVEPRPSLKTIKLGGRRPNPVERAPRIPSTLELHEPDDDTLAALESPVDPQIQREAHADIAWATAVQKLNDGDHAGAEVEFLAFAAAHPQHPAADNALYYAGLVREVRGDCEGALPLLASVPQRYPAGDAVPQALLEHGRCLRILSRRAEAKEVLTKLVKEHAGAPEVALAGQLLQGL